eukprot:TRINITY_DN7770_c0_g1_i1.p1 TRINITY_DN7770_c0_g1~~TRINITY_DN7770_c0_g1_i1.p1  ORF type:complete len:335 (+),score=52.85 TRINITY_DN7770_c0_g1_i1:153-1157(+)
MRSENMVLQEDFETRVPSKRLLNTKSDLPSARAKIAHNPIKHSLSSEFASLRRENELPHVPLERFDVMDCIGEGSYGSIWKAQDRQTGQTVVLKRIEKKQNELQEGSRLHNEMKVCAKTWGISGTPQTYGYFEHDDSVFLVMEMIKGMDLYEILEDSEFDPFPESRAKKLFKDTTQTLIEMHRIGIAHKDIKLENIMIDFRNDKSFLIDFGLSFLFDPESNPSSSKCCSDFGGSMEYSAPEVLARAPFSPEKSDVYALGVTLFCSIVGTFPHVNLTNMKDVLNLISGKKRRKLKYPLTSDISEEAKDLLSKMLADNPHNRYSLKEVIDHPWFRS